MLEPPDSLTFLSNPSFRPHPQAPRLAPELELVRSLICIGKRLSAQPTKEAKTSRLLAELSVLNLNLPARVYLPLGATHTPHHVVRIPPPAAVVLNSKDKVGGGEGGRWILARSVLILSLTSRNVLDIVTGL